MAMPSPASDSMEIDFAIMAGISTFHLQGATQHSTTIIQNGKGKTNKNEWYQQQNMKCERDFPYLNETRDQVRPIRLEYVLGFLMSFLHTIINISLVITLAGGMVFGFPSPTFSPSC